MSVSKGDYSISLNADLDTSQVQKTYRELTADVGKRKIEIPLDIKTKDIVEKLDSVLNNKVGRKLDETFDRINTKMQSFTRTIQEKVTETLADGTTVDKLVPKIEHLTKVTETFKNSIGDVKERVSFWGEKNEYLTSSLQTIQKGVNDVNTETNTFYKNIDGVNKKITEVTETMVDTSGETRTVITTTEQWVDAFGQLNTQITKTNEKGTQLAPTYTKISDETKKAAQLTKELATAFQEINKVNRTETKTFVDKDGNTLIEERVDGILKLTTKIREYRDENNYLVKETQILEGEERKLKDVKTEKVRNLQKENEELSKNVNATYDAREATRQLAEEERRLQEAVTSTTTTHSRGMIDQFNDNSGRQYEALITTVERLNEVGQGTITTTYEFINANGELVQQTRVTDEALNKIAADEVRVSDVTADTIAREREQQQQLQNLVTDTNRLRQEEERLRIERERMNNALVSSNTSTSRGMITQFGDTSGRQYEALITTIREVDREGRTTIRTIQQFTNAQGQLVQQTRTTDAQLNKIAEDEIVISENANRASNSVAELGDSAVRASNGANTLGQSLANAFTRLVNFYVASLPIRMFQTAVSEATNTLREFDSALIEFRKVSDLAGDSLQDYVAKLAEMGEVTGSTMQAMVEAATEFKKSGFDEQDSAKLASVAEMYRNIADEEISAADSASFIIAQMKAFNVEAQNSEHIIDAVNEVANNFAVSSADLATNLGKMSATMAVSGVSLEQQIGMLTGVTEITRNASTASRGLVMITSRLTQTLDDSSSTGKKLTAIYEDLGISLKDSNGQLRSAYDILGDLALQWDNLSENEQKYIALTSAGARQQQNFVALMKNFDNVVQATATAYNSAGSAAKENSKVMDSIEKKTQILRSEFQQLVIGEGGLQDVSKVVLDLGINLLKLANTPVGKITLEIIALTTAIVVLGHAINSLTIAMAANPYILLAMVLAGVVVAAIELSNAEDELTRTHKENIKAVQEANEEYETLTSEIDRLKNAIADIEDKKVHISDKDDLENLQKQEDSLKRQLELLEAKAEIARKEAEAKAKEELNVPYDFVGTNGEPTQVDLKPESLKEGNDAIRQQAEMLKELQGEYNQLQEETTEYQKRLANMKDTGSEAYQNISDKIESNTQKSESLKHQIDETTNGYRDFLESTNTLAESLTSTDEATQSWKESLVEAIEEGLDYIDEKVLGNTEAINENTEALDENGEAIEDNIDPLEELAEAHNVDVEALKDWAKELGTSEQALCDYADSMGIAIEKAYEFQLQTKMWNESVDSLQSSFDTLKSAVDEYNESQELSVDTVQALLNLSPEYLGCLEEENGQLKLNEEKLIDKCNALIEEQKQNAISIAVERLKAVETGESAQAEVDHKDKTYDNIDALEAETDALYRNAVAYAAKIKVQSHGEKSPAVDQIMRDLEAELSVLKKVGNSFSAISSKASKAGKSGSSAAKEAANAQKELNKELEETKKKYETVIKWINKQYDKKIKAIQKEKKEATDAISKEIKAREKEKDKALDAIEAQINALEKEKKAREKYWDDQIDALKDANKERKDALELQEKLDALEKARNTRVKIYKEGQGFVYDVDQNKVAEAQKELDEYLSEKAYEDELDRLEKLKDAESDNYQKRLDALNEYKDSVQKSYEEQIDALKEHKDAVSEQYDEEIAKYQEYKDKFAEMVDAYEEEQNKLLLSQFSMIDFENENWMTRLDNLQKFVDEYHNLLRKIDGGEASGSVDKSFKSANTDNKLGNGGKTATTPDTSRNVVSSNTTQKGVKTITNYVGDSSVGNSGAITKKIAYVGDSKVGKSGVVTLHANGVGSIKDDELAIVGENPHQEIVIGSKLNNGALMSLNKGTGVVNADSSTTLAGMLNQVGKFGSSGFGSGNGTLNNNINNDSLVVNGVTIQGANINDPQTFVNGLLNLKSEALQRAYRHR